MNVVVIRAKYLTARLRTIGTASSFGSFKQEPEKNHNPPKCFFYFMSGFCMNLESYSNFTKFRSGRTLNMHN